MSRPMRDRKTCHPATRNRLVKWFEKALKLGYDEKTAKRVAIYVEERLQQGGHRDHSKTLKALNRKTLTGGKELVKDFDRLTK